MFTIKPCSTPLYIRILLILYTFVQKRIYVLSIYARQAAGILVKLKLKKVGGGVTNIQRLKINNKLSGKLFNVSLPFQLMFRIQGYFSINCVCNVISI